MADERDDETTDATPDPDKALHNTALGQFKFIAETEHDQRARELRALKFRAGDHWPEEAKASRAGLPANPAVGSPAVPARPMLVMRTLDQPIAQIVNQEQDADLAITIVAKDGQANKDTAEVIAGLVRAIQVDSHADDVYSWGFQRMSSCGRGYWRVNKAYADELTGIDQVIRIEPIENGFSVYRDPLPKWQPNGGFWEPEYTFITADLPEAEYKRQFGKSKLAKAADSELLSGLGDDKKHWVIEGEDGGCTYRVAEYFYAVYETVTTEDLREVSVRKVMWAKMNGVEWLEEPQEWDGRFIPIIEDTGNRYNVGGDVITEGMVQPAESPCLMLDFMVSSAAEKIGIASLSPWLAVAGQLQNYEAWWHQANLRNFPYLEYNAVTAATGSQILPPPTRNNDEPAIQAYAEMIGLFTNFIRSTTGVPDAALGHVNPNDRSGKAIEELKIASQQGTSGWLTHHARAIRHTGIVVVDLIPAVYDRPGRAERIIGKDGAESEVILNEPFARDQSGQPQPVTSPEMFSRMATAVGIKAPQQVEEHYLDRGKYGVIVNVGKSKQTLKQETFAGMNALAQAPDLVPRFADLWVESMDIPQAEAIAARIKPPGVDGDQMDPQQMQAQMAQLQQVNQELQKLADDNQAKMAIAQQKSEADLQKAQLTEQAKAVVSQQSDETKLKIAGVQAETQIAVAEIKAGMDELKQQVLLVAKLVGAEHEARMAQKQAEEEAHAHLHDTGHDTVMTQRQHEHELGMQAREHEHAASMPKGPTNG